MTNDLKSRFAVTFREKISKLLISNAKEISTVHGLEVFLNTGQGAIAKYIREDREPPLKLSKKIVTGFGVNQSWWDTGKGEIFSEKGTPVGEKIAAPGDSTTPLLMVIEAKSKLITFLEAEVARLNKELAECRNALTPTKKS